MKVLEVVTLKPIRDPHRPLTHALTQNTRFQVPEVAQKPEHGYELELHPSGLAVYVKGRSHTTLALIESVVMENEVQVAPVRAVKGKAR